jgi:hypothetical protein
VESSGNMDEVSRTFRPHHHHGFAHSTRSVIRQQYRTQVMKAPLSSGSQTISLGFASQL